MSRLEGVKVGDMIRVTVRHGSAYELYRVGRLTATQAVCNRGAAFKIGTGLLIGSGGTWSSRYGSIATEAEIAEGVMQNRIKATGERLRLVRVTADNLEAAEAFIAASQPKEPT